MQKKLFILDTNLSLIYDERVDLEKFSKFLKKLTNEHLLLIITDGWYEQVLQICNVFDVDQVDIIAGNGAILKRHDATDFQYFGFINKNDVDLVLHLAIASHSGIIVKGMVKNYEHSNVFLNYFLNFHDLKNFQRTWKFENLSQNNDYFSFEKELLLLEISEIYVFKNNNNFATKFFEPDGTINNLLKERSLNIYEFLPKNFIFTKKGISKMLAVKTYLKTQALNWEDVVYISLGQMSGNDLDYYNEIILPFYADEAFKKSATYIYDPKEPQLILEHLKKQPN